MSDDGAPLLHVGDESASEAVLRGVGDEHWRWAERCLKVAARHEVAGAGDDPMAEVARQAARALERMAERLDLSGADLADPT